MKREFDILGWAQLWTGRLTCCPRRFNLAEAFLPDLRLLQKMAADKGVQLETSLPDDAVVEADPSMIAIVVRNLMTNAVKFTAPPTPPIGDRERYTVGYARLQRRYPIHHCRQRHRQRQHVFV